MKLTLQIKLLPDKQQMASLLETIRECNKVCNEISDKAWENKTFNQYKLHHIVYHTLKKSSKLSAQSLVRCISKVANAYKSSKEIKNKFRIIGAIKYDSRILSYKPNNVVSIWSINGRLQISFICHNLKYIPYIKGEANLVYKKGKYFLFQTVDVPEEDIKDVEEFIGVDFGLIEIATISNGTKFNSKKLQEYRIKRQRIRSSLQSKCTKDSSRSTKKNVRKILKRLSGKERTHGTIINHTISKQIVQTAKSEGKGIAIEDLKNIRFSSLKKSKKFRTRIGNWSFNQLRKFITYKSLLNGIPLVVVSPAYTSQMCNQCYYIGERTGKTFACINPNCKENILDSDINAAKNISLFGASIAKLEKSSTLCCSIHNITQV